MRTSNREQLVNAQRKALDAKRSTVSKLRKEKRKAEGRTREIAKAIKRSPKGKKAAESMKAKRGIARKKEQANYQKSRTRASARMGEKKANPGRVSRQIR
jgi:hypothetical protein